MYSQTIFTIFFVNVTQWQNTLAFSQQKFNSFFFLCVEVNRERAQKAHGNARHIRAQKCLELKEVQHLIAGSRSHSTQRGAVIRLTKKKCRFAPEYAQMRNEISFSNNITKEKNPTLSSCSPLSPLFTRSALTLHAAAGRKLHYSLLHTHNFRIYILFIQRESNETVWPCC